MIKVFLDANIFFAAIGSPHGGSGKVLDLCKLGRVKPFTIPLVLLEVDRNIRSKLSLDHLILHYENISTINLELVSVDREKAISEYGNLVPSKDAPILAGAIKSGVEVLITLDQRHFFTEKTNHVKLKIIIETPGDFLKRFYKEG